VHRQCQSYSVRALAHARAFRGLGPHDIRLVVRAPGSAGTAGAKGDEGKGGGPGLVGGRVVAVAAEPRGRASVPHFEP